MIIFVLEVLLEKLVPANDGLLPEDSCHYEQDFLRSMGSVEQGYFYIILSQTVISIIFSSFIFVLFLFLASHILRKYDFYQTTYEKIPAEININKIIHKKTKQNKNKNKNKNNKQKQLDHENPLAF